MEALTWYPDLRLLRARAWRRLPLHSPGRIPCSQDSGRVWQETRGYLRNSLGYAARGRGGMQVAGAADLLEAAAGAEPWRHASTPTVRAEFRPACLPPSQGLRWAVHWPTLLWGELSDTELLLGHCRAKIDWHHGKLSGLHGNRLVSNNL